MMTTMTMIAVALLDCHTYCEVLSLMTPPVRSVTWYAWYRDISDEAERRDDVQTQSDDEEQ